MFLDVRSDFSIFCISAVASVARVDILEGGRFIVLFDLSANLFSTYDVLIKGSFVALLFLVMTVPSAKVLNVLKLLLL